MAKFLKIPLLWIALLLVNCTGSADLRPVNQPGETNVEMFPLATSVSNSAVDENVVGLAFSGGGMRASAFSYGVLKSLSKIPIPHSERKLTDQVKFVSGVSGGSVTAAYFALKPQDFYDFRQVFLDRNAEEGISTELSLTNFLRIMAFGGANDRSGFPTWLDKNVFHGKTYKDVLDKQPALLISASDIFNRTPFIFSKMIFRSLCSDLYTLPISHAVAASAAVPGAFAPINIESFADECMWEEPPGIKRAHSYYGLDSVKDAVVSYRDPAAIKYIKLLDGGLTDNFGIQAIMLARLASGTAYAPIHRDRAIRLKRMMFIVVNAGRSPKYTEWSKRLDNPNILELTGAVTDTAIDSNVRVSYDFLQMIMTEWQQKMIKWRCSLPPEQIERTLGKDAKAWKCDDVQFFVTQVAFSGAEDKDQDRLNNIPTRFVLPKDDIDFLIESADVALKNNAVFQKFVKQLQ